MVARGFIAADELVVAGAEISGIIPVVAGPGDVVIVENVVPGVKMREVAGAELEEVSSTVLVDMVEAALEELPSAVLLLGVVDVTAALEEVTGIPVEVKITEELEGADDEDTAGGFVGVVTGVGEVKGGGVEVPLVVLALAVNIEVVAVVLGGVSVVVGMSGIVGEGGSMVLVVVVFSGRSLPMRPGGIGTSFGLPFSSLSLPLSSSFSSFLFFLWKKSKTSPKIFRRFRGKRSWVARSSSMMP